MSRFSRLPGPVIRSILLLTMLGAGLCACAGQAPIFLTANDCSSLIPDDWAAKGVESAALPQDKTIGGWVAFGDAQTGQLDKANSRTQDVVTIIKSCEARDRDIAKALQPKPWWQFW